MDERSKRTALIVGAIVLALLSIVAGALIALSDDAEPVAAASPTPGVTATDEPSVSPEPSESETSEPSRSESPTLEDGRHFAYVTSGSRLEDGSSEVEFDLAYFYTGERAEQEAAEDGNDAANGYYIVNDNDRLRVLPLADDAEVAYVPADQCCELQPGTIDAWLDSITGTNPTDYGGIDVPWWITVAGGEITGIEQQYLP